MKSTRYPSSWPADLRHRMAGMALVCLAMLAALATPFFLQRVYTADDLGEYHLPIRAFYAERLAAGAPFDWMPSLYCGFFLTGEGQLGGYHPLHYLLYRYLPLGAAFDWELLVSYPCLLAGTFFLFRRLTRRADAALFGAMIFTFSGFCLLHFIHPNAIAVVAHIPWLLGSIDMVVRPRSSRQSTFALAAIALLTGSQCLLGYPQYVWLSLLVEIAFTLWRLVGFLPRPRASFAAAAPVGLSLIAAKACGALIGAQQLAPTIAALRDSARATPDIALANHGSLHPLNMIQFVAPYLFTTRVIGQNTQELGMYCGAVPLLLCVWLWRERADWGRAAPVARAGFSLVLLGLLLAMGEHAGLYELQRYVPGVNRFRFPCRAIVLVHLALALLTAVAWSRLTWQTRLRSLNSPRLRETLAISVATACGAALAGQLAWPEQTASLWLACAGPALVIVAAILIANVGRARRWALIALPIFTACDLGLYGFTAGAYRATAELRQFVSASPAPPASTGRVVSGRDSQNRRHGDRLLLAKVKRADGYAGLEPQRRLDYRVATVRRAAGVAYFRGPNTAEGQPTWQAVERPLARARLLTRLAPGGASATLEGVDVDRVAAVEQSLDLDAGPPGKADLLTDEPGRLVIQTTTAGRQLLTIDEAFDVGWEAAIDGKPAPIVHVNADFMGVAAPRGQHRVELRFAPPSLLLGRWGSALGLGLLALGLCFAWATGQMAGPTLPRIPSGAGAARRSETEALAAGVTASGSTRVYFEDNPFVRIPKL